MYVFAVPLLNISVKHDLKGNIRQLYLFILCGVLSAVRNIYRWGIFSVVFTLLYCKDTDIPVTSLPDRKVSDKSELTLDAAQGTGLIWNQKTIDVTLFWYTEK